LSPPDTLPGHAATGGPLTLENFTLEDLEAVRLLLRGGSVIDWHRLDFRDHPDVDRFLRVNEFDPSSASDMERLEELRFEAVEYLSGNFAFRIPEDVAEGIPARDLLLIASRRGRRQIWACVVLKVMHIIHHLAGRELATRLSVSDDAVFRGVELKVMQVVEELRAAGYPIVEFEWSRKQRDALITKLLAKRSTLAAKIYDKLRFRLIVRSKADLVPILAVLTRRLIPFNYVVPGESINHLVSFRELIGRSDRLRALSSGMQHDQSLERRQEKAAQAPLNEFSGPEYKIINFVADLPVRVDMLTGEAPREFGHVVFALTEFQLCDKATSQQNEIGESSHDAYKARQQRVVRLRLLRGRRRARYERVTDELAPLTEEAPRPARKREADHRNARD
jgi:uncharacterized protein (TIGR04552 family)